MIQILPDAVQGWFLLEKTGLSSLERSVIQAEIKGNFTVVGVENALRSHWPDDHLRKQYGEPRHQANFGANADDDEDEAPQEEWDEAFVEDWSIEAKECFRAACQEEQQPWVQMQQAKRTLRDARARQHEVRMSRKFFWGNANSTNSKPNMAAAKVPVGQKPTRASASSVEVSVT